MASRARHLDADANSGRSTSPATLLGIGSVLVFMTFMRDSLAPLGWVVFAPFLVFICARGTLRRHLALFATLVVAFVATVSKMNSWEIPWGPVPFFAAPLAVSYFVALSVAGLVHRRVGVRWGVYTFASAATALGWIQYTFTPGSSWGVLAHTQLDNLQLVQLAALTGVGGVTFLVALGSGLAAAMWTYGARSVRGDLAVFLVALAGALVYGELRLSTPAPGPLVRVGEVVSPVTHREFFTAFENIDTLRPLDDELFARSEHAAELGAEVVVWPEIATLVPVEGERSLTERGRAFAEERGVLLLMAYAAVESMQPFHYMNKYRLYLPDGTLADEYIKRHPVPVDPETPGTRHARVVVLDGVGYTGAICYDYGFPAIARDNARDGGDIALIPSSDWRGIDPGHGRMALMNAVAVGLPMVRPVRAATSIATDQYGRLLAALGADNVGDGVLIAAVPAQRVPTLYARTGEVLPIVALLFCALAVGVAVRRGSREWRERSRGRIPPVLDPR